MPTIHLTTVLAEIDQYQLDGRVRTFALRYFKSDGRRGEKVRARKGGAGGGSAAATGGRFGYKVKEKGTLQLINDLTGQPFAVKIRLLTHYNDLVIRR